MPGFHNRYPGMPVLNSYSMPGSATCDTGRKALCPVSRGMANLRNLRPVVR